MNWMKSFKSKAMVALLALVIAVTGFVAIKYYSYVFSKKVSGEIIGIERVNEATAILGGNSAIPSSQLFSFAIAIRTVDGEIMTASSEDRQWAVAHKGQCVEASYYPYAPWNLQKAGTYFGARLLRLYDCPEKSGIRPFSAPSDQAS